MIGETAVGKSSLLLRFADDAFTTSYISTIGVDFRFKMFDVNGRAVKLQIWDTAGQERFRTITSAYYRAADGIVVVYDVTNRRSFEEVPAWIAELAKHEASRLPVLLLGNKSDRKERNVAYEDGRALAQSLNIPPALFHETSAKSGDRVDAAFRALTDAMIASAVSGTPRADEDARRLQYASTQALSGGERNGSCC